MQVIIIGAGAAGLIAAIAAARCRNEVLLLEKEKKAGKKLSVTGNGKCNYTNYIQTENCYYSEDRELLKTVWEQFSVQDTIAFFQELGIYPKEKEGYIYPYSEQASSVTECLLQEALYRKVKIKYMEEVIKIEKQTQFLVHTRTYCYKADRLVITTGGMASSVFGSNGSGYLLAQQMGHQIIPPVPALTGLKIKEKQLTVCAGVRIAARLQLEVIAGIKKELEVAEQGELQITNYGISGIPVFQISRLAAKALQQKKQVIVSIDFFPILSHMELFDYLKERKERLSYNMVSQFLTGMFPQKVKDYIIMVCCLEKTKQVKQLTKSELQKMVQTIKQTNVSIWDTNGFDHAQVTAGGIPLSEIEVSTMESRLVKGLFFAGELLDVDGICGGYNLQWAWSSGYIAGKLQTKWI